MTDDPHPHHREFTRVHAGVAVELVTSDGAQRTDAVRDIGLRGVFVTVPYPLPVGTRCQVILTLGEGGPRIEAAGRIVRVEAGGVAIEFLELIGLESLDHLRNLVRYNGHDPDQIEHEFHDHLGIKRNA